VNSRALRAALAVLAASLVLSVAPATAVGPILATLTASTDTYTAQRDVWLPYLLTLGPHNFLWFRLLPADQVPK